jgi:hypothetical protein
VKTLLASFTEIKETSIANSLSYFKRAAHISELKEWINHCSTNFFCKFSFLEIAKSASQWHPSNAMLHRSMANIASVGKGFWWTLDYLCNYQSVDIIHRPVLYLKHHGSEIGFCLRILVEPTQWGPMDRVNLYLRCVKKKEDRTTDNVQNCNNYINIPSSQIYRSGLRCLVILSICLIWSRDHQL